MREPFVGHERNFAQTLGAIMQNHNKEGGDPRSVFVTTQDGLRLHVRDYGWRNASALPAVCLPGLARTVADFDTLAPALASGRSPRRVIAIDSRGRGQSEYDKNAENYNVVTELGDVITVLSSLGIGKAIFIGSSRGGILTMLLAAARPEMIAGALLHDIGPVIDLKGLARIKSYVGKLPQPCSFDEGADILHRLFSAQFPRLTTEAWRAAARRTWKISGGALTPTYDVRLAETLVAIDAEHPLPPMWEQFDALASVPVLVIRGALSDLLSAETIAEMKKHHPAMRVIEVADEGHVPLLAGDDLINAIVDFAAECDRAAGGGA